MTSPSKAIHHLGEAVKKGLTVGLGFHNGLPGIAPTSHVIERMFKLKAKRASHSLNLANLSIVLQDLTPNMTPNTKLVLTPNESEG